MPTVEICNWGLPVTNKNEIHPWILSATLGYHHNFLYVWFPDGKVILEKIYHTFSPIDMLFPAYPQDARGDPNFVLPTSSVYHHENRQHLLGRRPSTKLQKIFGRSPSPSPHHSCTRDSLSLDYSNCETFAPYTFDQKSSGSSHPTSNSRYLKRWNPMSMNMTTSVPKGPRAPRKTSNKAQRSSLHLTTTPSTPSPIRGQKSMDDIKSFDQQSRNHPYTGNFGLVWPFQQPLSMDSNITSRFPSKERVSDSLPKGTSKFRVVGRGGHGSRSRQISLSDKSGVARAYRRLLKPSGCCRSTGRGGAGVSSKSLTPLKACQTCSSSEKPDAASPRRRLLDSAGSCRPTGRGGAGLSSKPLTPLKFPATILDLLRGRKKGVAQSNEPCESQYGAPSTHQLSQQPNDQKPNNSLPKPIYSSRSRNKSDNILPLRGASFELEGLDPIILRHSDNDGTNANPYIADVIRQTRQERHQRRLNKLAKTLGDLPPPLVRQLSKKEEKTPLRRANTLTNLGDKFTGPRSTQCSLAGSTSTSNILHIDSSESGYGMHDDSSVEDNTPPSPIIFSPPSPIKTPLHTNSQPFSLSGSTITTSPTRKSNFIHSRSLTEPSLFSPSSPATHSHAPDHYPTTHSDVSIPNDSPPNPPPGNGLTAKSNWLVPLGTRHDDVVISITRAAPTKPQSWTGEWNDDMQDVIANLRRL